MTASPGEIKQTLWQWQTDDFEAESLFQLLKLELRAWLVQRCLCNQGSHQTLQPTTLPAFYRLAATKNIPWREQSSLFASPCWPCIALLVIRGFPHCVHLRRGWCWVGKRLFNRLSRETW
jgi:hypothetical protein